jgi:hypothetical protein
MYSGIQQFSSGFAGTKKNIIVITDGVPNAKSGVTYTTADGITCGGSCTDADMLTGAQTQATAAKAAGISISTIYYSGDTSNPIDQATYAAALATLVTGSGVAMVAPTAAQIATTIAGFCATMPSSLKVVM